MAKSTYTVIKVVLLLLIFFFFSASATQGQDAGSLKATIEAHYKSINTGQGENVNRQHREDISFFYGNGSMLVTMSDFETANRVGFSMESNDGESSTNVVPYNFSAKIYDNVGLATFYLWGSYGTGEDKDEGMWRVSAVWIFEDGVWREAHHHESPLVIAE